MYSSTHDNTHGHSHGPTSTDFIGDLKIWWTSCPLFTRCLIFFCSFICLLSQFSEIAVLLVNIPERTLGHFELTRLFFSPFTFYSPAELLFGFLAYIPLCAEQEKAVGTLKVAVDFFVKNLTINIVFIFVCYILSIIHSIFITFSAYGLWGIFFAQLIEKYLDHPQGNTSFLNTPFHIESKYYPLALLILFSIISNIIRMDIVAASLVGFLHHRFLNIYYHALFNDRKITTWETSTFMAWIRTLPHYTSHGTGGGGLIDSHNHSGIAEAGLSGTPPNAQGGFKGFGGSNRQYAQVEPADIEDLANDIEKP